MSDTLGGLLADFSEMIDNSPANAARDPEARTWGRLSKVAEEGGEVIRAYIGVTGQNPRKGVTHTMDDVRAELLDTAITALAAYEHVDGHHGNSVAALVAHVFYLMTRLEAEVPA